MRIINDLLVAAVLTMSAAAFVMAVSAPAIAADSVTGTVVSVGSFIQQLVPYVVEILMAIVLGLATWLAKTFKDKLGVDLTNSILSMEAKYRDTLHSALTTAVNMAVAKSGAADLSVDVKMQLAAEAVQWVMTDGAKEAVEYFGLTPDKVAKMALAKMGVAGIGITPSEASSAVGNA